MKRLIVVLLALATFCPAQVITGVRHRKVVSGAGATITVNNSASNCLANSNVTVTISIAAGHIAIAGVWEYNAAFTRINFVKDNNAIALTQDNGVTVNSQGMAIYSYTVPGGGITSVTANSLDVPTSFCLTVFDITSSTGTLTADGSDTTGQTDASGTTWHAGSTPTTSGKTDIVVGLGVNGFGPLPGGSGSWTGANGASLSATFFQNMVYQVFSSAGSSATPTGSTASSQTTNGLGQSYRAN